MLSEPRILIVGAGAAGISAAVRLLEKDFQNITILEAKNRIGGRIHTVDFSENVVELGAQWVHGERGNKVFDLAFPHKLLDSSKNIEDFSKHTFVTSRGQIVPKDQSIGILSTYYEITESESGELKNAEGSYGEYFTKEYFKRLKDNPFTDRTSAEEFLEWVEKFDNSIQCSDSWFDVSAKGISEYWTCEGNLLLNWKDRGYKTVFDLLLKKIPDPAKALPVMEKVDFNKDVSTIDYSSGTVIVKTKDGSKYLASHVIFTGSLGVLKAKHSTIFTPVLPEIKQRAIKGLSIGTANKIFLEFPHRWWQEDSGGFSLIWKKGDKEKFLQDHGQEKYWLCDVFEFFTVDYQPRLLCGWIVGPNARYIETLTDAEVRDGLCLLLDMFLGKTYNIPAPDRILRSKWHTDDHVRGSYSFRSMDSERLNVYAKDLAEPITTGDGKPILMFAGEATHDHYYSTVHGAIESGIREADRILNFQSVNRIRRVRNTKCHSIRRTRIAIVGAGIAGLAAAQTLEEAGFTDYLLLEAQEYIGGRINSVAWNKSWIECGAQFLHGDKSRMAEFSHRNQLLSNILSREGEGLFLREDGSEVDDSLVLEIDDFVRSTLEECENRENENAHERFENIGRVLRSELRRYMREKKDPSSVWNIKKEIFDWIVRFLIIDNSCLTLDQLSVKNWGKFLYVGGPEYLSFKAGYNSLTKLIANGLTKKNILLNTAVECVEWRRDINVNEDKSVASIALTLSDKSKILADCVIITCSLGYLKENHKNMFEPPIPSILSLAIENLGFGLINKIFLDFGAPWWKPGTKGFQFLWQKTGASIYSNNKLAAWTRDLTGFDVLPDHRGVLLGWVGGRGANVVETLSEQQVATDCVNLLGHYLKRDNIPKVKKCKRSQWGGNKYIRGSYSHIPVSCDENGISPSTLAEPVWGTIVQRNLKREVPILMFAGEATHEHYYSTTHGAYDTGVKQAETFLKHCVSQDMISDF